MVCDHGTMGSLYNSEKVSARASEVEYIRKVFAQSLIWKLCDTTYTSRADPDLDAKSLGRLLLVWVTATTHFGDESISRHRALGLVGKTLSRYPIATQQSLSWEIMQRGASSLGHRYGPTAYSSLVHHSRGISKSRAA